MQEQRGASTAAATRSALKLTTADMPEAAVAADKQAVRAQKLYQRTVGVEQFLLIIAAAGALVSLLLNNLSVSEGSTYVAYAVAAALAGSVAMRGLRSLTHPDVNWYDSRSLAEELQSQSWRYAMRATPYEEAPGGSTSLINAPDMRFVEESRRIRESSKAHLPAESRETAAQIPAALQQVRDADLAQRIEIYKRDRLKDQHGYYFRKAKLYQRRARLWNLVILGVEGLALVASGAKFVGLPSLDLFGLSGTIVAGAAAWVQMKQFSSLSRRYSAMARNLEGYLNVLERRGSDQISAADWAELVNHIEQLLENEHEGWLSLQKQIRAQGQQNNPLAGLVNDEINRLPRK